MTKNEKIIKMRAISVWLHVPSNASMDFGTSGRPPCNPAMLFADRMQPVVAHGRPFAPLIPPQWASTALAYLKEIDILVTRKTEVRAPKAAPQREKAEAEDESTGSPRRRPKFPKKPKEPPAPKA